MWKSWRNVLEPWRVMPGLEFDLLRTLPPETARELFRRAWRRASLTMSKKRWYWALFALSMGLLGLGLVVVWAIAANLGLGPLGRIWLELACQVTVGLSIFRPLVRLHRHYELPFVRDALAEVLLRFAQDLEQQPQTETRHWVQ